jgi:hypothetical protein
VLQLEAEVRRLREEQVGQPTGAGPGPASGEGA